MARHNLGAFEVHEQANLKRGMKHYMIAAKSGSDVSLKEVRKGYRDGFVTKEEYANTLRAYQNIRDEIKSDERAKVAEARAARRHIGSISTLIA